MWHEFLVVLCDRCRFGTETVWGGCELGGPVGEMQVRSLQVWDGFGICRCGAGADKNFQPVQDSSVCACIHPVSGSPVTLFGILCVEPMLWNIRKCTVEAGVKQQTWDVALFELKKFIAWWLFMVW